MDVKKIEKTDNKLKVLIKGTNNTFVNALRRTIMNSIPTLAIENIAIYENSSILFDEFLGHRLGLVPISMDLKGYQEGGKVKMTLVKEGPCMVYSKDIKSKDHKVEVAAKNIPIVKLKKGQKIKLEMEAVVGTGKEHVKWQPAVVAFKEVPAISLKSGCDLCNKCIIACPKNILEIKAKKIVLKDQLECDSCSKCKDECPKEILGLEYDGKTFVFSIESSGMLNVKEIFSSAIKVLAERNNDLKKQFNKV